MQRVLVPASSATRRTVTASQPSLADTRSAASSSCSRVSSSCSRGRPMP